MAKDSIVHSCIHSVPVQEWKPYMIAQCRERRLRRSLAQQRKQPAKVMTVDEDSGTLLLPRTYVTRHGRLVLYSEDPLATDLDSRNYQNIAATARDAYVNKLLKDTFNGNLLYLAASILAFGDDVRNVLAYL